MLPPRLLPSIIRYPLSQIAMRSLIYFTASSSPWLSLRFPGTSAGPCSRQPTPPRQGKPALQSVRYRNDAVSKLKYLSVVTAAQTLVDAQRLKGVGVRL
jgi:hypothetical protein